jgi:hypothetical protein
MDFPPSLMPSNSNSLDEVEDIAMNGEALNSFLPPAMRLMELPEQGFPVIHGLVHDEAYKFVH